MPGRDPIEFRLPDNSCLDPSEHYDGIAPRMKRRRTKGQ
jgi:hypothetical protein